MSCNGCRVLRKGCNENCILRQSLQGIDTPQAQAHATVFVAKFFGRAGLMSFLSAVPDSQRPALFQSLLFEACGRTVNPVNGAVGLLWTGNWHMCQSAVETVLRGGAVRSMPELFGGGPISTRNVDDDASGENDYKDVNLYRSQDLNCSPQIMRTSSKRKVFDEVTRLQPEDLDLGLMSSAGLPERRNNRRMEKLRRAGTPSEESETTTLESGTECHRPISHRDRDDETKLLRLFL